MAERKIFAFLFNIPGIHIGVANVANKKELMQYITSDIIEKLKNEELYFKYGSVKDMIKECKKSEDSTILEFKEDIIKELKEYESNLCQVLRKNSQPLLSESLIERLNNGIAPSR